MIYNICFTAPLYYLATVAVNLTTKVTKKLKELHNDTIITSCEKTENMSIQLEQE